MIDNLLLLPLKEIIDHFDRVLSVDFDQLRHSLQHALLKLFNLRGVQSSILLIDLIQPFNRVLTDAIILKVYSESFIELAIVLIEVDLELE